MGMAIRFALFSTAVLLLAACSPSATASICDGWRKLTPSAETRAFIIEHDRPFAIGVASHNGFGASRGCWK